jgi:hypothetical protein
LKIYEKPLRGALSSGQTRMQVRKVPECYESAAANEGGARLSINLDCNRHPRKIAANDFACVNFVYARESPRLAQVSVDALAARPLRYGSWAAALWAILYKENYASFSQPFSTDFHKQCATLCTRLIKAPG